MTSCGMLIDVDRHFGHYNCFLFSKNKFSGNVYRNEEKQLPQKYTFYPHLLDKGGQVLSCVEGYPVGAIVFGDLNDKNSKKTRVKTSQSEFKGNPEVSDSPKRFISGEVLLADRKEECAQGIKVTLEKDSLQVATVETDRFGDFEFGGLEQGLNFTVKVAYAGYVTRTFNVNTKIDVYLGEIELPKE